MSHLHTLHVTASLQYVLKFLKIIFFAFCSTFGKSHMSIDDASQSCTEILGIMPDRARDLALFAKHQGFGVLGSWTRDECMSFGEALRSRNLDCRVVPFGRGGGLLPSLLEAELGDAVMDVAALRSHVENSFALPLGSQIENSYLVSLGS